METVHIQAMQCSLHKVNIHHHQMVMPVTIQLIIIQIHTSIQPAQMDIH